jgi:hypothetical protein
MKTEIDWTKPIFLFARTDRATDNDLTSEGHENFRKWTKKVDLSEPIAEIPPEEFPIDSFETKVDFEEWLQQQFGGYADGVYYLFTRCLVLYPRTFGFNRFTFKRKIGRPKYSYSHHGECSGRRQYFVAKGEPAQRRASRLTCVAKFEIFDGEIISVPDRRTMRKHSPYNRPKFPIIAAIERKSKRKKIEEEI